VKLLHAPDASVDPGWLGLYGAILADRELAPALRSYFLRIEEQPMDRAYVAWFPELVRAREALMSAVNGLYRTDLVELFNDLDTYEIWTSATISNGIGARMLKHVLLDLIAVSDTTESHMVILDHFRRATTANDKVARRPNAWKSWRKPTAPGVRTSADTPTTSESSPPAPARTFSTWWKKKGGDPPSISPSPRGAAPCSLRWPTTTR